MKALNEKSEQETATGVLTDGTQWKRLPRWPVTKDILTEYISLVTKAANAAIDKHAVDPREDAARALAMGIGAAMVVHGRRLNAEGYEQGDFECKASLGLLDDDGTETARYHPMRVETDARHRVLREADHRSAK
jgi:hypothetical protein